MKELSEKSALIKGPEASRNRMIEEWRQDTASTESGMDWHAFRKEWLNRIYVMRSEGIKTLDLAHEDGKMLWL